jgi:hypothetical protein
MNMGDCQGIFVFISFMQAAEFLYAGISFAA